MEKRKDRGTKGTPPRPFWGGPNEVEKLPGQEFPGINGRAEREKGLRRGGPTPAWKGGGEEKCERRPVTTPNENYAVKKRDCSKGEGEKKRDWCRLQQGGKNGINRSRGSKSFGARRRDEVNTISHGGE